MKTRALSTLPPFTRRAWLKLAGIAAPGWLGGCGAGSAADPAPTPGIPGASPPPSPEPGFPAGKYRSSQPYLFQTVTERTIKSRLPDGSDYLWDVYGPTARYVDLHSGWLWDRPGGDWIDARGVRHGETPWFSAPVDAALGSTAVRTYTVDVSGVLEHCEAANRWCAFKLIARNAPRTMAGLGNADHAPPFIQVTFKDGGESRLNCRLLTSVNVNSFGPSTTQAVSAMPAFVEFERPTKPVGSAVLHFVVTEHWSGANARIDGFLLDPPTAVAARQTGVASQAGALDDGIDKLSGVIGVHRYTDGTPQSAFVHPEAISINSEKSFDPAIYGTGPQDVTKLPHVGLGKFVGAGMTGSLVPSSYTRDGFAPLAPGLGAMRFHMQAAPGVTDGSVVGSNGTLAGDAMIFLPESLFGRLDRIFVRYYFRLAGPYRATVTNRRHVYREPGLTEWTTYAGKFGIAPDHSTSYGGVSGSSGGGYGWQMRHSWYDCDAGTAGPDEGGWAPGYHLYDFYFQNPPGYNYGHNDGTVPEQMWGQRGGLGGILYANRWYCIETELKLNTVLADAPGFVPDGELRTWIDGRLAYERTGMVFRTQTVTNLAYAPDKLRPCRELGIKALWLNWFHGGRTVATFDRTTFYTGLVWSTQYIGPMKGVSTDT